MEPASHAEQVGAAQGLNQLSLEGDRSNGQRPASPATPIDGAITLGQALLTNLGQVVLGARDALTAAAVAALSGGHLLIEDVPGVGKTVLARALATSLGAELSRVRATLICFPPTSPAFRCFPRTQEAGTSAGARCSPTWCSSTSSTAPRPGPSQPFWRPWRSSKSASMDSRGRSPALIW